LHLCKSGEWMKVTLDLHPEMIIPALAAKSKDELLIELATHVVSHVPGLDREEIVRILQEREKLGSTGIGDGIAIPHGKLRAIDDIVIAFGRSPAGIDFNALDNRKAHLFFLLLAPENAAGIHLKTLARISRIMKDPAVRKGLLDAADAAEIHAIIREQDSRY
jgi:nitrogen PTS system EIIA component